jgi:tetratricopeptide (TPR) repeat protein
MRTILAIVIACFAAAPVVAQSASGGDPDALYRQRENLANAERAASIWAAAPDTDFEAAWKLARAYYWLGTHQGKNQQRRTLELGVRAGERAVRIADNRPEGHFWLAANMGRLAQSFGLSQGIKYRGRIKSELERVLAIDPSWQGGSAHDALGQWYASVPGLFGGSGKKAEEHFQRALAIDPNNTSALTAIAERLIEDGRKDEARVYLQRVLDAPIDPEWEPEEREFKERAAERLRTLRR